MSAMNISVKALLLFFLVVHSAFAQIVLEDDGLSINEGEFEFLVSQWPSQMQTAAANNLGDRLELLNKMIMLRRMAAAADNLPPETKESWELSEKVLILKREFLLDNFAANLKVPDMSALSAERYDSEKRQVRSRSRKADVFSDSFYLRAALFHRTGIHRGTGSSRRAASRGGLRGTSANPL